MPGMLSIVPTPIGNLKDMTYRAVETLNAADIIACEDTRHSLVLLQHYGIRKPLVSFHKFNAKKMIPGLLDQLREGKNVALVSDAGMPGISDPGGELLAAASGDGIACTVLPGACALVNAAVLSGMCEGGFTFSGFLPEKNKDRETLLSRLCELSRPVIFYSSPHAVERDIAEIAKVFNDRRLAVCRELTKLNEEVEHTTLALGLSKPPRGEYVLVVEGKPFRNDLCDLSPMDHLQYYIGLGIEKGEAIKKTASDRKVAKNEIYRLVNRD